MRYKKRFTKDKSYSRLLCWQLKEKSLKAKTHFTRIFFFLNIGKDERERKGCFKIPYYYVRNFKETVRMANVESSKKPQTSWKTVWVSSFDCRNRSRCRRSFPSAEWTEMHPEATTSGRRGERERVRGERVWGERRQVLLWSAGGVVVCHWAVWCCVCWWELCVQGGNWWGRTRRPGAVGRGLVASTDVCRSPEQRRGRERQSKYAFFFLWIEGEVIWVPPW